MKLKLALAVVALSSGKIAYSHELPLARDVDLTTTCEILDQLPDLSRSASKAWKTRDSEYISLSKVASTLVWSRLPPELPCGRVQLTLKTAQTAPRLLAIGRSANDRYLAYEIAGGNSGYVFGGTCIFKLGKGGWRFVGCTNTYVS